MAENTSKEEHGTPRWWRFWSRDASRKRNVGVTTAWITTFGTVSAAAVTVGPSIYASIRGSGQPSSPRVATIVHTRGEKGIHSWSFPFTGQGSVRRRLYTEGQVVEIVCQIRDGQGVNDPGDGRPVYTVAVWDKLADGTWIPDLYTNLPNKRQSENQLSKVPICSDDQRTN